MDPKQSEGGRPPWGAATPDGEPAATYANVCRVHGTPEEVVLDFGLHGVGGAPGAPVRIAARVALSPFSAKRLAQALATALRRHEETFGPVEPDPVKRILPRPPAADGDRAADQPAPGGPAGRE